MLKQELHSVKDIMV